MGKIVRPMIGRSNDFPYDRSMSTIPPAPDNAEVQQKCEQFLRELQIPGFIVFGWQKSDAQFGVVSSFNEMPVNAAVKGMTWALNDFVSKSL